jgi:hypothetical protein
LRFVVPDPHVTFPRPPELELGTGVLLARGGVTETHMQLSRETAVYRVCATTPDRWEVFQDAETRPVASFCDKSAALTYAMGLARGRASWQLLLTTQNDDRRTELRH